MSTSLPLLRLSATIATITSGALVETPALAQDSWAHPAAEDPPPAPPEPPLDTSGDARVDTVVLIHVDAPEPVELQRQDGRGVWRTVCSSPCDRAVAEHRWYRLAGDGVRPSSELWLAGRGQRITIEARPSSRGWFTGGIVLASVGGAAIMTGAFIATVVAAVQGIAGALGARDQGNPSSTERAGLVTMGVGAMAVVTGVVAIVTNPSTRVSVRGAVGPGDSPGVNGRQPTLTGAPGVERPLPTATWAPLFSARF